MEKQKNPLPKIENPQTQKLQGDSWPEESEIMKVRTYPDSPFNPYLSRYINLSLSLFLFMLVCKWYRKYNQTKLNHRHSDNECCTVQSTFIWRPKENRAKGDGFMVFLFSLLSVLSLTFFLSCPHHCFSVYFEHTFQLPWVHAYQNDRPFLAEAIFSCFQHEANSLGGRSHWFVKHHWYGYVCMYVCVCGGLARTHYSHFK